MFDLSLSIPVLFYIYLYYILSKIMAKCFQKKVKGQSLDVHVCHSSTVICSQLLFSRGGFLKMGGQLARCSQSPP